MSKLLEYRKLEKHLAEKIQALNFLKSDARLKKELEFEKKLHDLLAQYGFSLKDLLPIIDPSVRQNAPTSSNIDGRKLRKVKVYNNPYTGEVLQTKGGNQRTLKLWKKEHGAGTVEGWLTN